MSLPFPTLQLLLAIVLAGEIFLMRRRLSSDASRAADRGSLRLLLVIIFGSVRLTWLAARLVPQARFDSVFALGPPALACLYGAGLALFAACLGLRWFSVAYLGRLFTYDVVIVADHRVVDSGPYRHIRHPAYSGSLLTFLGLGICGGNALALLVLLTPVALAFLRRIAIEEAALTSALGHHYGDYTARTRRLIPLIY